MSPINAIPLKDEKPARKQSPSPQANQQGLAPTSSPPVQRDTMDISRMNPSQVLSLQRSIGNQEVQKLVASSRSAPVIQAKLEVGPVGDRYEQEADRIAATVVNSPLKAAQPVQREKEEGGVVQMKRASDTIQRDHGEEEEEESEMSEGSVQRAMETEGLEDEDESM